MTASATASPRQIAFFSPLPPARSGIADYSAELLPALAPFADLTLFVDDPAQVDATLADQFPIHAIDSYPLLRHQFDLPLYHVGNSTLHASIYATALRYPGVVVLHDWVLHHFIGQQTAVAGDFVAYGRELSYALGRDGVQLVEGLRREWTTLCSDEFPLSDRLVDASLAVLVHSRFVADKIAHPTMTSWRVQQIDALVTPFSGKSRRAEAGFAPEDVVFGCYGQLTPSKQLDVVVAAFARVAQTHPRVRLLLVGEPRGVEMAALLAEFGVADRVFMTGFVPSLSTFVDWIHSAEIAINLRHPTMGETSATALRALAAGQPLLVTDAGWYGELPDSAVVKLPPNDVDALAKTMAELAADDERRAEMGAAAREVAARHAPDRVAQQYAAALDAIWQGVAP